MNEIEVDSTPKDPDKPGGFVRFMGCMGLLAFLVCISVIASILNGWALSVLWGWFVVPTFALPNLGIVQAIGLSMVINLFLWGARGYSEIEYKDKKVQKNSITGTFSYVVMTPFISVFLGWIVHHFM